MKEKPGKDEKKSKVRPIFWVGEGRRGWFEFMKDRVRSQKKLEMEFF